MGKLATVIRVPRMRRAVLGKSQGAVEKPSLWLKRFLTHRTWEGGSLRELRNTSTIATGTVASRVGSWNCDFRCVYGTAQEEQGEKSDFSRENSRGCAHLSSKYQDMAAGVCKKVV